MALIATPGDATANSYVTVAEATAYFTNRLHADAWNASTNQSEAEALITASKQLDWYVNWNGAKATGEQAMQWPRTGVLDDVGDEYANTVIPENVKVAVFELALSSLESDRMEDSSLAGIAEVKVGSLQVVADDGAFNSSKKAIPPKIWKILRGLCQRTSGGSVRLIRG